MMLVALPSPARADDRLELTPPKPRGLVVESVDTAFSAYVQDGIGYQSKAGQAPPFLGAGSERLTVFQPQFLVVLRQNEHLTHRIWVPIDVVTSASANAIDSGKPPDMLSQASRQNQAIALDWTTIYQSAKAVTASAHNAFHVEENFRSWSTGVGGTAGFVDDLTVVSANAIEIFDWFSGFDVVGNKTGRVNRATTSGNVGLTQILTPTTVAHVNYGLSSQIGTLSNTWNSLPLDTGQRLTEQVPRHRTRHALVARFAQWLPWDGALKGFYRFYADDWGLVAHTAEVQLLQRLSPQLYARGSYRWYTQTGVDFFTLLGDPRNSFYTADSDLGRLDTQTAGFKLSAELPQLFQGCHVDLGYERYWRSDGLTVSVALWQAGARF
jgi:hypothetical protein